MAIAMVVSQVILPRGFVITTCAHIAVFCGALPCTALNSLELRLPITLYGTTADAHGTIQQRTETRSGQLLGDKGETSWRFLSVRVVKSIMPIIFAQEAVAMVQWLVHEVGPA